MLERIHGTKPMRRVFIAFVAASSLTSLGVLGQTPAAAGRVEGSVLVGVSSGRAFAAGATVRLSGPVVLETETDENGNYTFAAVASGSYRIEAFLSGLEAARTISVEAGNVVRAELQLKPANVKSSVTVTATAPEAKDPAASETISEKTLREAPNADERFESALPLIPGVVRGPDGRINLKGARATQSGALVNSANVTDPATGIPAINVPIDVVSSVQVISNPYDPQYGKLTGAVSTVETKTSNYGKFHFSVQNLLPRVRDRDGTIQGIGASTPRLTVTGPIVKDRIAFTQSVEYRFVRTPVNSLPALERDTKLESFDSYTQVDFMVSSKQTATVSFALYPQKLNYFGLNTFTPQPATPDFHQRGYQVYAQHRYLTGTQSFLTSQFSYKTFDADITAQNDAAYRLLPDTTEGGFFSRQARRTSRVEWQENYQFAPRRFLGSHQFRVGLNYAHSSYHGRQTFLSAEIADASDTAVERITFTAPTSFAIGQNETAWYAADQWSIVSGLIVSLGARFDSDTVTGSTHTSPRAGFLLSLTRDSRTILKGGVGIFYDRVPLMMPVFAELPNRSVTQLGPSGEEITSTSYRNEIIGGLRNPSSTSWNLELDRKLFAGLLLRVAYEQRNTGNDFIVSPLGEGGSGILSLSNGGSDSYKEFQLTARYQIRHHILNASYLRSRAFGDLNDFNQFFGTLAQPVIQPNARGRLAFDAPNRFLLWGSIAGPWKLTLVPVYDLHTGFPYSVQDEFREYVGPRNTNRYPRFSSFDLQVTRRLTIPVGDRKLKARAGIGIFNVFNHFNPRDVQNNLASAQFGSFFNDAWREYRGKFVLEF
jgi:hypothetical protein